MNLVVATLAIFLLQIHSISGNYPLRTMLLVVARINIILGSFNLIPIPPLDGSKVLMGFLPTKAQISLARIEPYGFFILILLLFTGMLNPVIVFVQNIILGLIGLILGLN